MRLLVLTALVVTLLASVASPADARPMHTPLEEVLDTSPHIVVATFLDQVDPSVPAHEATEFRIDVIQVLRGDRAAGEWVVKRGEHGTPGAGPGPFVAFVDEDDAWNFVATPQTKDPLPETWFVLRGFFDFNAHVVTPGVFTWPQLEAVLEGDAAPDAVFEGALWFVDDTGVPAESEVRLTVQRSLDGESVEVTGMPALEELPDQPGGVWLSPGWEPELRLIYGAGSDRPMEVVGEITGIDEGVLQTQFRVDRPLLVTEALFDAYRNDADTSGVLVGLEVVLDDGGTLTFEWSDGIQRRRGPVVAKGLGVEMPDDLTSRGVGYAPERELTFGNGSTVLRIEVDAPATPAVRLAERGGALVSYVLELLQNDPMRCTVHLENDAGVVLWTQRGAVRIDSLELAPDGASLKKGSP